MILWRQAGLGEASKMREAREEHEQQIRQPHHHHMLLQEQQHHHQQQHNAAAPMSMTLHINRPTDPISSFASPPPIQQTTVMLDNPYHVPGILLQTDKYQVFSLHLCVHPSFMFTLIFWLSGV